MRAAADPAASLRLIADALLYRLRRVLRVGNPDRVRLLRLKSGVTLAYRLDRGDVRTIAETWLVGAYELPVMLGVRNLVDLGCNIGATGVWLARRYGAERVVAVEPVPDSARLARINFDLNRIEAEVVQAAIGPEDGVARFRVIPENSTLGHLAEEGSEEGIAVRLISPATVLERFPPDERIDLLKLDVEGAEAGLFAGDLGWLDRVDSIVAELHSDLVDADGIVTTLVETGFATAVIAQRNPYLGVADQMVLFMREPARVWASGAPVRAAARG